jgi:hypothetical protein
VASFLKCFDPGCRREPTVRQSRSVYIVRTNQHDSPYQNGVNALVSHLIYQPHSVCSVRKCIYKATVGVRLINQSATVVWNGMQSHCGTLASNTKRYSPGDVASTISIGYTCNIYWVLRQVSQRRNLRSNAPFNHLLMIFMIHDACYCTVVLNISNTLYI